jgi:CheY-like chemotaxis protein
MARVLLIHWNEAEAAERAARLREAGFDASHFAGPGGPSFRALADNPPDAIVIDLSRLPSQGGAAGIAFRQRKASRHVPLLFIEGDAGKTARVRALLPDAVYASWPTVARALREALDAPAAQPVVPDTFAGYAGTPLVKKLGIRAGSTVALRGAPEGFAAKLSPLPEGARLVRSGAQVTLAFMSSLSAYRRALPRLARAMEPGRVLWIVWPKKTSRLAGDLGELEVRALGLKSGLVDYKICAVDATWSGLAFALREKAQKTV